MTQTTSELAETLMKQGIVFSKTQALEMAEGMLNTSSKVEEHFEAKKEEATTGYQRNEYAEKKVQEMRENALSAKPIEVQTDYETPANAHVPTHTPMVEETTSETQVDLETSPEPHTSVQEAPVIEEKSESPANSIDLSEMFNFGS